MQERLHANTQRPQDSKEYAYIYRKFAMDFTQGQDFTHGPESSSCLACGLSAFGARLPSMNDQLSQSDCLGMQAELLALVKIEQVKEKGAVMLTQLISLLPIALNAANYC